MPRKPRKTRVIRQAISPCLMAYFLTGEYDNCSKEEEAAIFLMSNKEFDRAWETCKEDGTVSQWIKENPCSRPWGWWEYEAPEPRRRLGGTGTLSSDLLAYTPLFSWGIPLGWTTKREVDIYKEGVAVDPADPPKFESQAAYLQRHGLLNDAEQTFLKRNPALLEPEKVKIKFNDD